MSDGARRPEEDAPPRRQYLVVLRVRLSEPISFHDEAGAPALAAGYYRTFGVTAGSDLAARAIAEELVDDGRSLADEVAVRRVDVAVVDVPLRGDPNRETIWYMSGRILYGETDDQASAER